MAEAQEHLISCALIRDGKIHSGGCKEHWRIRAALGDKDPYVANPGDVLGFLTSVGRFVDRREARQIGSEAGQCQASIRDLLSSDVDRWDLPPEPKVSRQVRRALARKSRGRI